MNIKKLKPGPKSSYPQHLISTVCRELLSGTLSYTEVARKYNMKGTATIRNWMLNYQKQYGSNLAAMTDNNTQDKEQEDIKKSSELKELQSKNEQLQAALELARLENLMLNTMIDIADEQLHTDIRKKSGAKQ